MPPLTRNNGQRELQVMIANPAKQAHAVATGQQGGLSGTIPGVTSYTVTTTAGSTGVTGSGLDSVVVGGLYAIAGVTGAFTVDSVDSSTHITMARQIPTTVSDATMIQAPQQLAIQYSTLQPLNTGDQVAGVGHAVLANDGTPAVMMGNLAISGDSGYPPSAVQDGAFAFTDASGNAVAGYSHPTGLWGFGGEGTIGIASFYSTWGMGFVYSGLGEQPTWGTTIAIEQPDTTFNHPVAGCSICQTGYIGDGNDGLLGPPYNIQYQSEIDSLFTEYVSGFGVDTRAVVSAYALDGSSYATFYGNPYTSPLDSWSVYSSSGSLFSTDGTNIIVAEDYMIALNFALLLFVSLD